MSVGQWINNNPAVGIIITVVALGVAGFVLFRTMGDGGGAPREGDRYWYDLSSGELVVMEHEPAPVATPSGSQAVWAHVFSCGSCDDPSQRFVAYIQKMTEEAKAEAAKPESQRDWDLMMNGERVALPPDEPGAEPNWVPAENPNSMRITESHMGRCPTGRPTVCEP